MRYLAFALALSVAVPVQAAELIMFEQKGCVWCEQFDREVAPAYAKTSEGQRAPLRRVDIGAPLPGDLAFVRRERFTPVFVLVDQGREFGRIRGYPGDTFFWGLLANMIERLDRGEVAPADNTGSVPPGATFAE
jgi:hypothetical protein